MSIEESERQSEFCDVLENAEELLLRDCLRLVDTHRTQLIAELSRMDLPVEVSDRCGNDNNATVSREYLIAVLHEKLFAALHGGEGEHALLIAENQLNLAHEIR